MPSGLAHRLLLFNSALARTDIGRAPSGPFSVLSNAEIIHFLLHQFAISQFCIRKSRNIAALNLHLTALNLPFDAHFGSFFVRSALESTHETATTDTRERHESATRAP